MTYRNSELKKALTTTTDGAALLPYDLDPMLHEELLELQPLAKLLDVMEAGSKTHEYSVRSSHPSAWFEGETTPSNQANSVYARKTVVLKILRQWGGVTGFARAVDEKFIDALVAELEGSLEGMADAMEYGAIYGCANDIGFTGDAYQFTGILPYLYKYAPANVVDAGGDKITLSDLDGVLNKVNAYRAVKRDPKVFIMSLPMKNVVDGLQTRVQIPLKSAELFDGKLTMGSYSDIPIFESDYVAPASTSTSPAMTSATPITGGSLDDDEYFYCISSITANGEQVAATSASGTTSGVLNTNALAWTADSTAKLYMIWRGLATGWDNMQLLDIIAAKTYDAYGTVSSTVSSYNDDGSLSVISQVKPLQSGEQLILCVNRNPKRGAAFLGKVDDMGRQMDSLMSFVELARTKDTYDYMLKAYMALRLVHPNLVSVIRHAKLV